MRAERSPGQRVAPLPGEKRGQRNDEESVRVVGVSSPLANERRDEAEFSGQWRGMALELWCALFFEHRRYRHGGEGDPTGRDLELLNRLCATLRRKLQTMSADEHALIRHSMATADFL